MRQQHGEVTAGWVRIPLRELSALRTNPTHPLTGAGGSVVLYFPNFWEFHLRTRIHFIELHERRCCFATWPAAEAAPVRRRSTCSEIPRYSTPAVLEQAARVIFVGRVYSLLKLSSEWPAAEAAPVC